MVRFVDVSDYWKSVVVVSDTFFVIIHVESKDGRCFAYVVA